MTTGVPFFSLQINHLNISFQEQWHFCYAQVPLSDSETTCALFDRGITGRVWRQSPLMTTVRPPNGFWCGCSSVPRIRFRRVLSIIMNMFASTIVTSSIISSAVSSASRSFLVPLFAWVQPRYVVGSCSFSALVGTFSFELIGWFQDSRDLPRWTCIRIK